MFLVIVTYTKPLEIVDQYRQAHRDFLEKEGYQKNCFVVSGPTSSNNGGIIVSQLTDRKKLEEIINHDPYHIHDIATHEIIEFSPVKYHHDFEKFVK